MLFRVGFLLASILSVMSIAPTVVNCEPSSLFHIDSLSLTPLGLNSTLNMTYTVPTEITDGVVKYSCTLNGIPVLSESKPLCDDLQCPISVGQHETSTTSVTPTVKGTLACTIKWISTTTLLCIKLTTVNNECSR